MGLKDMWEDLADKFSRQESEYEYEDGYEDEYEEEKPSRSSYRPAVASLSQQSKAYRMIVVEPYTFADSEKVADHLKSYHPVVINLEKTEEEVGRRLIDFVSGVTYALEGHIEQVSQLIFLAVPNNMTVDTENYTYTATPSFSSELNIRGGR